jgi:peptidoglycan/LPS O-acetylase OafA/YrhL
MVDIRVNKFAYIDALRGAAVLAVIFSHCPPLVINLPNYALDVASFGQMGVQLFFMVSAITLCLSFQQRLTDTAQTFFIRRVFRIAPLYYIGVVFYLFWGALKLTLTNGTFTVPPQYTFVGIVSNLLFLHGFNPAANNNVVPGGWSIATEMAFYLVFPLLFRWQARLSLPKLVLTAWVVFIGNLFFQMLVFKIFGKSVDSTFFLYCNFVNQFIVFVIGIVTFRQLSKGAPSKFGMFLAASSTIGSFYVLTTAPKVGLNGAVFPALAALGFSFGIVLLSKRHVQNLLWRTLVRIGKVSFSMYLFHFFILDIIEIVLKPFVPLSAERQPLVEFLFVFAFSVVLTYCVAKVSHKYIELNGISLGNKICLKLIHAKHT